MNEKATFTAIKDNGVTIIRFGSECDNMFEGIFADIEDDLTMHGLTVIHAHNKGRV